MSDSALLDDVGRESSLYARYTAGAESRLSSSEELQRARNRWEQFVVESHGDIFGDLSLLNPSDTLFIDTLYFDFVIDRVIQSAERTAGVRLQNPQSRPNTDALGFRFRSFHDSIAETSGADRVIGEALADIDLSRWEPRVLGDLYENVVSGEIRLALGEYYTPRGVADLAVQTLDVADFESDAFLDPGCGSGVFLSACIDAKRAALSDRLDAESLVEVITSTVFGIDLNPVAVKSAKLSYLLSLFSLLNESGVEEVELPVFLTDSLGLTREDTIQYRGEPLDLTVDHLVGNPPWITWGTLPEATRKAWRERYVDELDLLAHDGIESRLGHGNDDISVPFVLVCIHRYLGEGGDASFVLKRGVTKGPAGRLFRRQRVGSRSVAVRHVHDFNGLRPFGNDVAVNSAIYTLRADADPEFPIETDSWTAGDTTPRFSSVAVMEETLNREQTGIVPVDNSDPASSWLRSDTESRALGACDHEIRHGVKDDAKAVYSIEASQLDKLEHDHVYPYLRSKHVVKYGLFGHDRHLVPLQKANQDNERELRANCPETYEYLDSNRAALEDRSSSWLDNGPFYNLFGLGEYTWSPYKVVWCRLGFKPHFAVVSTVDDEILGEKTVVPGDHCMFISTEDRYEAHFLCALLNSLPYQQSLKALASEGKSSLSKTVVSRLTLPPYQGTAEQETLAELSVAAHEIVPKHTDVSKRQYNRQSIAELDHVQADIDALVEELLSAKG